MSQGHPKILKVIQEVGPALKLKLYPLAIRSAEDFDGAFQAATRELEIPVSFAFDPRSYLNPHSTSRSSPWAK